MQMMDKELEDLFKVASLLEIEIEEEAGEDIRNARSDWRKIKDLVGTLEQSRWIYGAAGKEGRRVYDEVNADEGLKGVFERHRGKLVFDRKLANDVERYLKRFLNLNHDHIAFFNDVLIGVNLIKFDRDYESQWWDILDVNESELQRDIHNLEAMDPSWHVAPKAFNQSCIWMIYMFHNTKLLNDEEREVVKLNIMMLLCVTLFSSMYRHFFNLGTTNRNIALATYANLSKKYGIKNTGSWANFFKSYSYFILCKDSKWYPVYTKHYPDKGLIDMVSGIQVSIKSVLINIRGEMQDVIDNDKALQTTGLLKDYGEGDVVVDVVKDHTQYFVYLDSCISNIGTLKKAEILDVTNKLIHTAPEKYVVACLEGIVANHTDRKVHDWLKLIVRWALEYANSNEIGINSLGKLIPKLRGLLSSSTVTELQVKEIKEFGDNFCKRFIPTKSANHLAATRNAVTLYIIIRVLSIKAYT